MRCCVHGTAYLLRHFRIGPHEHTLGCHFPEKLNTRSNGLPWVDYCGFLVITGEGLFTDHSGVAHPLYPGCFAQHLPGRIHLVERYTHTPWKECSLTLGRGLFDMGVATGMIDAERSVLLPGSPAALVGRFTSLQNRLRTESAEALPSVLLDAQQLLLTIRDFDRRHHPACPKQERLQMACEALEKDLRGELDLSTLAVESGFSYIHFRRCFREATGMSPGQFRLEKRMDAATRLLVSGEYSLSRVAALLGYADLFTFSRQYKRVKKIPPSQASSA